MLFKKIKGNCEMDLNFNVLDLKREKKVFKLEQFEHFERVLRDCIYKIKHVGTYSNKEHCNFVVPVCKIGDPIYKTEDLENYLIKQLNKRGFFVILERERLLYVSWKDKDLEYVKQQKLMDERKEHLSSENKDFEDLYNHHKSNSQKIDEIINDMGITESTSKSSRKKTDRKTSKIPRSEPPKTRRDIPRKSRESLPQRKKFSKPVDGEYDIKTLEIMHKDGLRDSLPVSIEVYNHILKYQDDLDF
jgi:hypothetical protein